MIDLDAVMRALKAIYKTLGDEAEVIILVVPPQARRRPPRPARKKPTRGQVLERIKAAQSQREIYLPTDPSDMGTTIESGHP